MRNISIFIISLFICSSAFALGPCFPIRTTDVAYLPSLEQCSNKAAVVLTGKFLRSYSVVTRDCNNNDRDPCYKYLGDKSCASNFSSPFKALKKFRARITLNDKKLVGMVYCFREAGSSKIYQEIVRRITIKRRNPVKSDRDIVRLCLPNRSKATAAITVDQILATQNLSGVGFSSTCLSQQYLACEISYCSICDSAAFNPKCG